MKKSAKLYQIEFIRFFFSVVIVYFHILHGNILSFTGNKLARYTELADASRFASVIVECFFILAGYFFYYSYWKNPKQTTIEFIGKKICRLWPVLAFSILIGILFFSYKPYTQIFNLLFLQSIGVNMEYQGINWYISPFFFAMIFYFMLLKASSNKKKQNLIICLLVYFSYVLNITKTGGGFSRETVYGVFNLGVFRAVGGIGLGYLLAVLVQEVKLPERFFEGFRGMLVRAGISIVEVFCIVLLLIDFLKNDSAYPNQFIVVILFSILLLCLVSNQGLFSVIFNHKIFGFCGKYSYSIYVMQQTAFLILGKTFWKNKNYLEQHMYRSLAISVVVSLIVGIITYYMVEKPGAKIWKK